MSLPRLFGFAGRAGSGKDTAGDVMRSLLAPTGLDVDRLRFALILKNAVRGIFGWGYEHTDGDLKDVVDPAFGVTPRHAMQTLGTEWGRDMIGENLWVDATLRPFDAKQLIREGIGIVTDVRFPNEAKAIQDRGGVIIWMSRAGLEIATPDHASEPSETDLHCEFRIENHSTLEVLRDNVRKILIFNGYKL